MEANSNHDANAKPPPLTSDQLNYLIWRYLQESGYLEAAVKLQRDWKVDAESLPFAPRIKGHALVSLVQKGLRYYHLHQTLDQNGQEARRLIPDLFFFGPDTERSNSPAPVREVAVRPSVTYRLPSPDLPTYNNGVRKHARESGPNGLADPTSTQPTPKRSRKSAHAAANNHADRGANAQYASLLQQAATDSDNNNGSAMEVDEIEEPTVQPAANGQTHQPRGDGVGGAGGGGGAGVGVGVGATEFDDTSAGTNGVAKADTRMLDVDVPVAAVGLFDPASAAPSEPQDQVLQQIIEPLPLISTLANGENVGVQVAPAKVAQLAPASSITPVTDGQHVTYASWHPADSTLLTTSGQTSCGLWKLPSANGIQHPDYKALFDPSPDTLVTAVAWEPSGSVLAVATYAGQSGRIHLYDGRASLLTTLPTSQRAIISLKWLPSGSMLVGVAASDEGSLHEPPSSSLLLWDLSGDSAFLAPHSINVQETLLDVDCVSLVGGNIICVAGDDVVYQCRATPNFEIQQKWNPSRPMPPSAWTFVKCTRGTNNNEVSIIAASADSMHLWMPAQGILHREVHTAPITGLQMRPRPPRYPEVMSFQEFATSSMDGTIKVWRFSENPTLLSPLFKVTLGHMSPVMALSYSLDGYCLAGAGYDKLRIYNADQGHHQPLAIWDGSDIDWRGASLKEDDNLSNGGMSSMNGDHASSGSDHCLSWDADSKKIAFALGDQLAIINFQR